MTENAIMHLNSQQTSSIVVVLAVAVVLLFIGFVFSLVTTNRLNLRLQSLLRGTSTDLETVLNDHMNTVHTTVNRMEMLEQAVAILQAKQPLCLRYGGLERYDAFQDVGGEQSFSLVLLDERGDGLVMSSVYSRSDVRVYAKSIQNGQPSHKLSGEEQKALAAARAR